MRPLRVQFAAVAAVVVVQLSLSPSIAREIERKNDFDMLGDGLSLPSFLNDDALFGADNTLLRSMSSLLSLLSPMRSMSPAGSASVSVSLSDDNQKTCRVKVDVGSSIPASGLKIGLHVGERRVNVVYRQKEVQEEHDAEKGDRLSSRSFLSSSSVLLPARCIATASVLLSNLAGYMLDSEGATERRRGLIIFPSASLLQEYIEAGLLPEDIISTIRSGDQRLLGSLTPEQLCLAAGFTIADCKKLGNKKPDVASVTPSDSADSIPIPLYDASLQQLD